MLIEFTVGNFLSFREPVTFSMVAAKLHSKDHQLDQNNTFKVNDKLSLLTSAAIYGANASGKSNLVKAMNFMRRFVLSSSKRSQFTDPINTIPFRLDEDTERKPSYFEIVFLLEGITYRYGFEVTPKTVESEWLFFSPHNREAKLFVREGHDIGLSRTYKGGQSTKQLTRSNALFLSVSAQFNNEIATKILGWFKTVGVISGLDDRNYGGYTVRVFTEDPEYRSKILNLILESDVGINQVVAKRLNIHDPEAFPKSLPPKVKNLIMTKLKGKDDFITFKSIHSKKCENGTQTEIQFDISEESDGTQKIFYLSGPVVDTLSKGKILIIDEIEARMHTMLTRRLVGLFNSEKTNPNHAQLIFATQDTNLLSNKLFRRDQIWFIEKDELGASHLYSLAELKVRNDRNYEDDYLEGRYGGIPILGEMRYTIIDLGQKGENDK